MIKLKEFFQKINAATFLRVGLGLMYLYSGIDIVRNPGSWHWAINDLPNFLSSFITNSIGIDIFLRIQGTVEILFAVSFLLWIMPRVFVRWCAILSTVEMLSILFLVGLDGITFRDIGLVGTGLALVRLL